MEEQHIGAERRLLDRRSRKESNRSDEKSWPNRPLGEDAFHETVNRYCRRFLKDGRDFCLASMTVLEFKRATDNERDSLDKAIVRVLLKQLRSEDRVCCIEPAHYLILIPSSDINEGRAAIKRVTEKISQTRVKKGASYMQPSASAKVVSAGQGQENENTDGNFIDPEALYKSVGYTLDSKGKLFSIEGKRDCQSEPLFRGSYEGWLERYAPGRNLSRKIHAETASVLMHDLWNANAPVEMRQFQIANLSNEKSASTGSALSASLLRRLRILQNLKHPGINGLIDFYICSEGRLTLVSKLPEGFELSTNQTDLNSIPFEVNAAILLSWLNQILSTLTALQSLVPPVVPSSLDEMRMFCCDHDIKPGGQIILSGFEKNYLLSSTVLSSESPAAGQQSLIEEIVKFILELAARIEPSEELSQLVRLLQNLDDASSSKTIKLSACLKKFVEEQHA